MEWQKLLDFLGNNNKDVVENKVTALDATSFQHVYRNWLIEQCTYLTDVPIGPVNGFPKLFELYCQPQLQPFDFPYIDKEISFDTFNLNEAMAQNRQLLFVAASGYGKTTLCRFLALRAANFQSDIEDETFPIYVPLKLLNHTQNIDTLEANASIETLLNLILPRHIVASDQAIQVLEDKLNTGRCLVIFDGLDDIVDEDVLKHWFELITQFSHTYSKNYIIVTSNRHCIQRCVEVEEDNSLKNFKSYLLKPFNNSDIESYVNKHFDYLNQTLVLDTTIQPQDFIEQIQANQKATQLCSNPMMLCMMFALYTDKVTLETDQAALYESYIQRSLLWSSPEGCHPLQWQFVLERIAYTMQKNNAPYIFDSWCKKILMSEFDNFNLSLTPDELDILLLSCRDRHKLFRDISHNSNEQSKQDVSYQTHIFEFSHKSFQDFLTAKQLHHKAQEGLTLIKTNNLNRWHQGEQGILIFYVMLTKNLASKAKGIRVKADEIIHWLLSLKDSKQEALFCAAELALYTDAISSIAIERIQDELEALLVIKNGYVKDNSEMLLQQLLEKYSITNEVILTHA